MDSVTKRLIDTVHSTLEASVGLPLIPWAGGTQGKAHWLRGSLPTLAPPLATEDICIFLPPTHRPSSASPAGLLSLEAQPL